MRLWLFLSLFFWFHTVDSFFVTRPAHKRWWNFPSKDGLSFQCKGLKATESFTTTTSPATSTPTLNTTDLSLGLTQLQPFLKIAVPYFQQDVIARNSLIAVSALTLFNSGICVAFSYVSRDFYNALNARDQPLFYEKIELFFGALCLAVPVSVFYRFTREKLSLYWREALTAQALELYYSNRTYYIMETLRDVDNPDQRITEDIRHFTKTSLDFFITIFTSIIDLFSFSAILFQIFPGLFIAIIIYAGIGSLVTTNLGQSLVKLNYERLINEANFRFALFRTRENVEAIAFYDGEAKFEQEGVWQLFQKALQTQNEIILIQRNLEFFTTAYRYIVQILPSLIVAPLYFTNKVELGSISQSYGAFNHILNDFSIIINSFESLSTFSAGLTRLATFFDRINGNITVAEGTMMNGTSCIGSGSGWGLTSDGRSKPLITMSATTRDASLSTTAKNMPLVSAQNLTIFTPDFSRVILGNITSSSSRRSNFYPPPPLDEEEKVSMLSAVMKGVDISINYGDRLLVVGESGSGKSSFVRALSGLWKVGYGEIIWNTQYLPSLQQQSSNSDISNNEERKTMTLTQAPKDIFFLPQKPYNVLGDLRKQIMYPSLPTTSNVMADNNNNTVSIYESYRIGDDTAYQAYLQKMNSIIYPSDEIFLQLLQKVRLDGLATRMGNGNENDGLRVERDWSKTLSVGEQQRLAFARVLYNQPKVLVLDEATSALDLSSEEAMYKLLQEAGVTYISVGHRPSLLRYHQKKLVLGTPGIEPQMIMISQDAVDLTTELIDLSSI